MWQRREKQPPGRSHRREPSARGSTVRPVQAAVRPCDARPSGEERAAPRRVMRSASCERCSSRRPARIACPVSGAQPGDRRSRRVCRRRRASPRRRAYPKRRSDDSSFSTTCRIRGLHQVMVEARFLRSPAVLGLSPSRQRHQHHVLAPRLLANQPRRFVTVERRHADVEEHHVGMEPLGLLRRASGPSCAMRVS